MAYIVSPERQRQSGADEIAQYSKQQCPRMGLQLAIHGCRIQLGHGYPVSIEQSPIETKLLLQKQCQSKSDFPWGNAYNRLPMF